MNYFINLFSPETYEAFRASDHTVSGFMERQRTAADRVRSGDVFVCYLTRLGRWVGLLEVLSGPFVDRTPIYSEDDPFVVRFRVRPLVLLELHQAIPIHDREVWKVLSFTREHNVGSKTWTGKIRQSLVPLDRPDGEFISKLLQRQKESPVEYSLDADDQRKLKALRVRRVDKDVYVSVPEEQENESDDEELPPLQGPRESHRIQGVLADLGARMGMDIWIPRPDRGPINPELKVAQSRIVERLPLNYDEPTLKTIENIDILWLRGRSIVRAFEVEHTTSVYSGLLRMADLLALQPNMDIRLHIVAPDSKRSKVFEELRRPVFSLLERGPLAEACTYLSYERLLELAALKNLEHMRDSVLDEYAEPATDAEYD